MTYDEAIKRLQEIVKSLETDEAISIDDYKSRASEAKELLGFCRNQLTSIETEINTLFEDETH